MDNTPTDNDQGKTPVVISNVTSVPKGSYSAQQTLNGMQTMNSMNNSESSSSTTAVSVTAVNSGPVMSKGLHSAIIKPPSSTSVIQTHVLNSQGATVTLSRPPVQSALNGNNNNVTAGSIGPQSTLVNNSQTSHIIKAEPPPPPHTTTTTMLKSTAHQAVSSPRGPVPAPGGIRALTPQMLAPRLPQTSPGQPSIGLHNLQLPPGMVLVRSESGQLLMIPQQALAQMQAQAQGGLAPRPATPTNGPPAQAPGSTIINRHVSPSSSIIRQAYPTPTTTLHRPPVLQSSVGAAAPGLTPRTTGQAAGTVTPVTMSKETIENVKKCKNFLSTLIKLASTGKQSTETAASVRELVKDLLECKLEAEEFTSRLYKELNSSPQPYLVPFLKRSLPALRQLTPDSAAFIHQSQLPQLASAPVLSTSPAPPTPSTAPSPTVVLSSPAPLTPSTATSPTVVLSSPASRLSAPVCRPHIRPVHTPPLPQQQRAVLRPQVTVASTPMVNLRHQAPGGAMIGQHHVHLREPNTGAQRPEMSAVSKHVGVAALTPAHRNKLREASGNFKDDDDINDVASMAGVNLSEESANILATNSGLIGAVKHSCKDEAFLSCAALQRRMLEIGRRCGVTDLGPDVVNYVSHAAQGRLRDLLEKVSQVAQQRNGPFKEDDNYEQSSDVRSQLKFFEQLDQLEKQRKEELEREILLKAAKSRARQEDPEQLRLKQKAKEMQQQELAQMRQREANLTALAAIGPRKKRKGLEAASASAAAEGSGSGPSQSGGAGSSGSRVTRQRITRVNLRDLLFCLENERFSSHSQCLYKGFLK